MAKHAARPDARRRSLSLGLATLLGLNVVVVLATAHGSAATVDVDTPSAAVPLAAAHRVLARVPTPDAVSATSRGLARDQGDPLTKYTIQPGQTFTLKPEVVQARKEARTPTSFRLGTLNVLGSAHTAKGGDRSGWASGATRMHWAVSLLTNAGVDVVGLQELQSPQAKVFGAIAGGYDLYPGLSLGHRAVQNSIAWRTSAWELVESHTVDIPYFSGNMMPMPYVLLRNRASGQEVWFINVHNPADKFGNAQKWRDRATAREAALINQLHGDGTPVILTGDMNDRERAFCSITTHSSTQAANGGSSGGGCRAPSRPTPVDWIFGSQEFEFSNYVKQDQGLVRKTTDHPFVWAEAYLPPTAEQP